MGSVHAGPFENIESAHEYVQLLLEAVAEATETIGQELETPSEVARDRHLDAFRLIDYKLKSLERHLDVSKRLLTDLRTLRRYLFDERKLEANYTPVLRKQES
jgi:hypothetical protein